MNNKLYPTDLTDSQWNLIRDMIPEAKPGGRPRTLDMHMVVNAILYIVMTGAQWRMLPREYPKWQSVYHYFQRWCRSGVWQRIHDTLRARVRQRAGRHKHATAGCLDSQSVKTAAGPGVRGYDAGKKVKGRKRHILVDTMGLLLVVVVTAASVQDRDGARLVFEHLTGACKKLRLVWVDGGYRGQWLHRVVAHYRFALRVVLRSDDLHKFAVLPRRWVVERTLAWITAHRRLAKDYEVLPANSEAMIHIAMTRVMLRRLAPA